MVTRIGLVLALAGGLFVTGPAAAATLFAPSPYLCFDASTAPGGCGAADSPFKALSFSVFHLETFEDGLLDTPGVTASVGTPVAGSLTDSVDADDGLIDGLGGGFGPVGRSFFSPGGSVGITFTFSAAALGGTLPTHAGLVWTDGGGEITFSVSGPGGGLCSVAGFSAPGVPDDNPFSRTAEDRFFGCSDPGGISSIFISNSAGGLEVDHLQYGLLATEPGPVPGVPLPSALLLVGAGVALLGRHAARWQGRKRS